MSLPVPLAVTLQTDRSVMAVTRQVRDLAFRSVAPGGFASAQISLNRPLAIQPFEIAYFGRLVIADGRSGTVVWEGRLEDPGRSVGSDGQVWDLAAIGPSGHAQDRRQPLIYVDRNLRNWERSTTWSRPASRTTVTDLDDGETPALLLEAPEGSTVATGWRADFVYRHVKTAGMALARFACTVVNGGSSSTWANELVTRISAGTIVDSSTWLATAQSLAASLGSGTPIPAGDNLAHIRIHRTGAGFTATENSWGEFYDVAIVGQRKDASGVDIPGPGYVATVLASQVVTDLLGRLLDQYDGPNAVVTTTSYAIDQLAYVEPTTAAGVLADLMELERGYYWAAWERTASGKYRFEWVPWPTEVRYEATVQDGYNSTGSAVELFNSVKVSWENASGGIQVIERTQAVPELDDAGITRSEWIALGADVGSTVAQSQQVGDEFLADHAVPLNAGQLTVARPILDRIAGRYVAPWEIRPGALIRVRGVLPRVNALNATARDGVSVFRIVSATFSARDASAQLELDSYAPSTARAIADLQTRVARRR